MLPRNRGSVLLVVHVAFCAAVAGGLWARVGGADLALVVGVCLVPLVPVLLATWGAGRVLRLPRGDAIVLLCCASKKSRASGVPMAAVLFPAAQAGLVLRPVMLFHQLQLIACAVIARHYADRSSV